MSTARHRVLFVDDDVNLLRALGRNLRRQRALWEMVFVESGAEALAEHGRQEFEVIVTDLQMPGMSGIDVVMEINRLTPATPCIILTGTADLETAAEIINRTRAFRFYTKPCRPDQLIAGIAEGISRHQSRVTASGRAGLGMAALDRVPTGVIVVSKEARVVFMNHSGAAILSRRDGLLLDSGGICRASTVSRTSTLHRLIEGCTLEDSDTAGRGLSVERTRSERPLLLVVVPFAEEGDTPGGGGAAAIVYVTDPDNSPQPSAPVLAKLFGLTVAESRLAEALGKGKKLEAAARELGITLSSARTYLKRIFGKTDTNRQAELVRLVLAAPTQRDPNE